MNALPSRPVMIRALLARDPSFEGLFFAGVRTTGVFCRPTCGARKPRPENVEFFATSGEALHAGFRPCRICRPLEGERRPPAAVHRLLAAVERHPEGRIADKELLAMGLDPSTARRRFRAHYGMTFQAYQRARRMGEALSELASGSPPRLVHGRRGYATAGGFRKAFVRLFGRTPRDAAATAALVAGRIATPLGPMLAIAADEGICLLEFVDRRGLEREVLDLRRRTGATVVPGEHRHLRTLRRQLGEYFRGRRADLDLPVVLHGSEFQCAVWEALRHIPAGDTCSYADVARRIGRSGAVRAVGRANGANRLALLVPCHRVIRSDGALCGYGGGLWRKRRLLELERAPRRKADAAPGSGSGLLLRTG
jgi:AraC family transcriptional regulator of adaptative response/methylated-DNA-[protein]-cysteine methyltransferase